VGGEGDADSVADALGQEDTDADGGADGAGTEGTGLRDAEVERVGHLPGDVAIGCDHGGDIEGLEGDLDVLEAHVLKDGDLPQGSVGHALGLWRRHLAVGQGG
jgi:hypothetical protein